MDYVSKIEKLMNQKKWDKKDFSRHALIDIEYLDEILKGNEKLTEEMYNELIENISTNKPYDQSILVKFDAPQLIAIQVIKGGVGKTSVAICIAQQMAYMGYKVLVIDEDAQMDSTTALWEEPVDSNINFFSAIKKGADLKEYIIHTKYDNIDLVPANMEEMCKMEKEVCELRFREDRLTRCMKQIVEDNYYDFVIIDMNTQLAYMSDVVLSYDHTGKYNSKLNVVSVADATVNALRGCSNVYYNCINMIENEETVNLNYLGVILNKVDGRYSLTKEVIRNIDENYPFKRLKNSIRVDATVPNSQWNNETIRDYDKNSRVVTDIENVTNEIIEMCKEALS